MRVSIVPSPLLLPQTYVKLGRLITNVEYPHQHHHDPAPDTQPTTLTSTHVQYTGELHVARNAGFRSTLTSLLSARFSKGIKLKVHVTTEQFRTYALENSETWFDEATRLPETRAWIERAVERGHDIYLIVGYHTLTDAAIRHNLVTESTAGGQADIPGSWSLAGTSVVASRGGTDDPNIAFQRRGTDGGQAHFVASGEYVCAVDYRKIRYWWLSSKNIDKIRLEDVRHWSAMERARDEEEGEDDIFKVGLEDVEDVDVDELDGCWDKKIVDDQILYTPSFDET